MIYFVSAGTNGAIKIGQADDPARRLAELQTGSSEPLFLLATLPGGRREEAALHTVFAAFQKRGEWFSREPVAAFLAAVYGVEFPETELGYEWPGSGDCCHDCSGLPLCWPHRVTHEDDDGIQFAYRCEAGHHWKTWYSRRMAQYGLEVSLAS